MLPLDLHVLGLSLAFILSQDQTLRCNYLFFIFSLTNPIRCSKLLYCLKLVLTLTFFTRLVLLCLFQIFNDLFFVTSFPKASAKVLLFSFPTKFFKHFFLKNFTLFRKLPISQGFIFYLFSELFFLFYLYYFLLHFQRINIAISR